MKHIYNQVHVHYYSISLIIYKLLNENIYNIIDSCAFHCKKESVLFITLSLLEHTLVMKATSQEKKNRNYNYLGKKNIFTSTFIQTIMKCNHKL